jgi:hypothetical protein
LSRECRHRGHRCNAKAPNAKNIEWHDGIRRAALSSNEARAARDRHGAQYTNDRNGLLMREPIDRNHHCSQRNA